MDNIITYAKKNSNITLNKQPFNPVDSLILSELAYLRFDKYTSSKNFSSDIIISKIKKDKTIPKNLRELFISCFYGIRYDHLHIYNPIDLKQIENEKQFAANCFIFNNKIIYVAYRGTDATLIGWKEDLNMSFLDVIPSQTEAKQYLDLIIKSFPDHKIIVGGHSKGGNLAVFASIYSDYQDKITKVYSHDGPGFRNIIFKDNKYKTIVNKIHKTIPQSSLFGLLMETQEQFKIIKSNQFWIFQHDPFSWIVNNNDFIYLKENTNFSKMVDNSLNKWLATIDDKQRKIFIDTIYEVFVQLGIDNFNKSSVSFSNLIKKLPLAIQLIKEIDPEIKKFVSRTIVTFFKIVAQDSSIYISNKNH